MAKRKYRKGWVFFIIGVLLLLLVVPVTPSNLENEEMTNQHLGESRDTSSERPFQQNLRNDWFYGLFPQLNSGEDYKQCFMTQNSQDEGWEEDGLRPQISAQLYSHQYGVES